MSIPMPLGSIIAKWRSPQGSSRKSMAIDKRMQSLAGKKLGIGNLFFFRRNNGLHRVIIGAK